MAESTAQQKNARQRPNAAVDTAALQQNAGQSPNAAVHTVHTKEPEQAVAAAGEAQAAAAPAGAAREEKRNLI